jgi:hypothetical protein
MSDEIQPNVKHNLTDSDELQQNLALIEIKARTKSDEISKKNSQNPNRNPNQTKSQINSNQISNQILIRGFQEEFMKSPKTEPPTPHRTQKKTKDETGATGQKNRHPQNPQKQALGVTKNPKMSI